MECGGFAAVFGKAAPRRRTSKGRDCGCFGAQRLWVVDGAGDLRRSAFFGGPKAVHFFRAGGISPPYLSDPNTFFAHRDYPPLLPLVYAWSHTVSSQFGWWAALLFTGPPLPPEVRKRRKTGFTLPIK
jgi:hypothetical protein